MATYTPQDADGVIISNTKDTKVTLDSEVVHAIVDSGTVTATGPLTDTQLRATAVPVSGTVTASGPLTDTQLRATAVPVSLASVPSHAVTNAGTFAVQAAAQPGVDIGDVTINNASGVNAVNIQDGGNTITVDGAVTVSGTATVSQATGTNLHTVVDSGTITTVSTVTAVTGITNVVHVDDNSGSLTVDNTVLSVVGAGTEATAQRVTIANDSTGVVSVDDNGGALTVDGATAIADGASPTIKATVLDLASGNPISVVIAHPSTGAAFGGVALLGADATTISAILDGGSGGQMLTVAAGSVVHGAPDANSSPTHDAPVKIGGKAASSAPTAVDAGDRVNGYFDLNGRLIVHDDQPITARLATDAIQNGTTALTPKFARINASTSGDNTLVAAVADKKIRVLSVSLISAGTVTANFQTAAAGAYLAGPYVLAVNSGFTLPFSPVGWFETVASDLLNLELSAAIAVGGCLTYVEV